MYIFISIIIIILDQWSKKQATIKLKGQGSLEGRWFIYRYVENPGAAMGFLKKWPVLLKVFSLILMLALVFIWSTSEDLIMKDISFAFIIGGGFGNILDRFTKGFVVDFFSPKIKKLPYFNIADLFVISGCILLVISEF